MLAEIIVMIKFLILGCCLSFQETVCSAYFFFLEEANFRYMCHVHLNRRNTVSVP